jgi:hypothetical protein
MPGESWTESTIGSECFSQTYPGASVITLDDQETFLPQGGLTKREALSPPYEATGESVLNPACCRTTSICSFS